MKLEQVVAEPFNFETYMKAQNKYIHELHVDAVLKGDFKLTTSKNEFIEKGYFGKGYDIAYRQYYCGLRHKPKWGEL